MAEVELPKHDELEELKEKTFTRRVALVTAVFAVVLAISSLGGSNATKDMLLAQQQSSDLWAFYQSKAVREHQYRIERLRLEAEIADRGPRMNSDARQRFEGLLATVTKEEHRYETEKQDIEHQAREKEHERDMNRTRDPYFDLSAASLQIAIVLCSIAILAGSRSIFFVSLGLAVAGLLLMVDGYTLSVAIPWLQGGA